MRIIKCIIKYNKHTDIAFSNNCKPTSEGDKVSAMMPDPTMTDNKIQVPRASAQSLRKNESISAFKKTNIEQRRDWCRISKRKR